MSYGEEEPCCPDGFRFIPGKGTCCNGRENVEPIPCEPAEPPPPAYAAKSGFINDDDAEVMEMNGAAAQYGSGPPDGCECPAGFSWNGSTCQCAGGSTRDPVCNGGGGPPAGGPPGGGPPAGGPPGGGYEPPPSYAAAQAYGGQEEPAPTCCPDGFKFIPGKGMCCNGRDNVDPIPCEEPAAYAAKSDFFNGDAEVMEINGAAAQYGSGPPPGCECPAGFSWNGSTCQCAGGSTRDPVCNGGGGPPAGGPPGGEPPAGGPPGGGYEPPPSYAAAQAYGGEEEPAPTCCPDGFRFIPGKGTCCNGRDNVDPIPCEEPAPPAYAAKSGFINDDAEVMEMNGAAAAQAYGPAELPPGCRCPPHFEWDGAQCSCPSGNTAELICPPAGPPANSYAAAQAYGGAQDEEPCCPDGFRFIPGKGTCCNGRENVEPIPCEPEIPAYAARSEFMNDYDMYQGIGYDASDNALTFTQTQTVEIILLLALISLITAACTYLVTKACNSRNTKSSGKARYAGVTQFDSEYEDHASLRNSP